jgi:outer membrane receptor for ferric coprogen and ferric-rhodotorulic acid
MTGAGDPSGVVNVVRKRPTQGLPGVCRVAWARGTIGAWRPMSGPLTPEGNLRAPGSGQQTNHTFRTGISRTRTSPRRAGSRPHRHHPAAGQHRPPALSAHRRPGCAADLQQRHTNRLLRSTSSGARWNLDRFETTNYTVGLEQQLAGDWQLKVGTTYMDVDRYALSGAYYSASNNSNIRPDGTAKIDQSDATATQRQRAIDATLQGPLELFGQTHELIFGANYFDYVNRHHSEGTDDAIVDFNNWGNELPKPNTDMFTPVLDYDVDTRQSGYFTAARFNLERQPAPDLGSRVSNYRYHYYLRSLPNGTPVPTA